MKTQLFRLPEKIAPGLALVALFATTTLNAQTAPPAPSQSAEQDSSAKLSTEDLNDLLGPIALYPDALVALILPASTVPSDITLAARYLNDNGDNANVDNQPWDESVKGLARYPDVLKWMDQNLEWTNSLGEAFVEQPADVMNAIQALRTEAKDKGNLVDTPQQTVVVEKQTREIRIVPTEPDVIYVPQYDPEVVYVQEYQPDYGPLIAFGAGFAVGAWLNYDCDWGNRGIYYGNDCGWNNHARWNDRGYRDGNVNIVNTTVNNTNINNITNNTNVNRWQASANSRRQFSQRQRQNLGNARIARANAAVRHPNGQNANVRPARAASVPKPKRINVAHNNNNGGKHPNAAVRNPNAPNAGKPNKGPNANGNGNGNGNNKHPNAGNNNNGGPNHHPKPATAAPAVNGHGGGAGNGNKHPNKNPDKNPSVRNPGQGGNGNGNGNGNGGGGGNKPKHNPSSAPSNPGGSNKPKHSPSSAPSNPGGSNKPKNPNNNSNRPKQPSAAPQSKPHVQQRPQSEQPKPQHHQQQPKPQQQRPQQQKPKQPQQSHQQAKPQSHPNGGGNGQQGNGNNNKKKKKDKDN